MHLCSARGSLLTGAHRSTLYWLIRREAGRVAIRLELIVQLVCAGLDGHACAVEALREEHSAPAQPVIGACEFQLRMHSEAIRYSQCRAQHCCRSLSC